jgi:hypothetical protein
MGQQQLLLVVLGVIVVGLAIAIALDLFRENAIVSKRDMLANECMNLGTMAMEYYRKPVNFGGGGRKFTGWSIPVQLQHSENGSFTAVVNESDIVITGTGNEVITGTDSIKVQVTIYPDSYQTSIIN